MEFKGTKEIESMSADSMCVPFILIDGNETIAQLYGDKAEYNMKLYKASPELLEALQYITWVFESMVERHLPNQDVKDYACHKKAVKVIKQALNQ